MKNKKRIRVYVPSHPRANKDGRVRRSRLVMEKKLGRYLKPEEIVHHKNGIKDNDIPENLQLFANESEHQKFEVSNPNHGVRKNWFKKGEHHFPENEIKKGQHLSPETEFKKGNIPQMPIKKGQHISPKTEFKKEYPPPTAFKKGHISWCKGRKWKKGQRNV